MASQRCGVGPKSNGEATLDGRGRCPFKHVPKGRAWIPGREPCFPEQSNHIIRPISTSMIVCGSVRSGGLNNYQYQGIPNAATASHSSNIPPTHSGNPAHNLKLTLFHHVPQIYFKNVFYFSGLLSIYLSVHVSMYPSIDLSFYRSIYFCICPPVKIHSYIHIYMYTHV